MENLHVKQQNVLRRKMEEAMASNKRLREVLEKQKNARKISRDVIDNKGGLAGAAERMRSVVTQVLNLYLFFLLNIFSQFFFFFSKPQNVIQELDMVVSVKEATQSRLQLVEDRKTLMKQLNDLKKKSRVTMVNTERDDLQQKMSGTLIWFLNVNDKHSINLFLKYHARALLLESRFLDSLPLGWPTAPLTQLLDQFSSRLALLLE
jgi:hypothetical protein